MEIDQKIIVSKENPGFKMNPLLNTQEQESILCQGAEGRIYLSDLWGQPCIIKERFKKEYRVPILDEKLTKTRILQEVKSMSRIRKVGVPTPTIYLIDEIERKIYMEYLGQNAMTVKEFIIQMNNDFSHPAFEQLVSKLAHNLATMHINDNIHGDLTSSNMMIRPPEPLASLFSNDCPKLRAQDFVKDIGQLYMIDFGLSSVSHKIEDKATDIYVLKRALISTHPGSEQLWERILEEYRKIMVENQVKGSKGLQIIAKFKDVERRGRKRECFG